MLVLFPVTAMFPVSNASVLAFELLDEKIPVLNVKELSVIVPAVSVNVPANVQSVGLPAKDRLMSDLSIVVLNETADASTVTVAAVPELASKVTVSTFTGADAPGAPPVVADQFAVLELSQVPEPPTQNLAAM
jgi:hypothetical protein